MDNRNKTYRNSKRAFAEDVFTYATAVLLAIVMALATLYGLKYGNVDNDVAIGDILIEEDGSDDPILKLSVDDDLNATVVFSGTEMTGHLILAGADTDSILYKVGKLSFADGNKASGASLLLRIPRSGLQGNYIGPWIIYYQESSQGRAVSNWVITHEDGSASVGSKLGANTTKEKRSTLIDWSETRSWSKDEITLLLSAT